MANCDASLYADIVAMIKEARPEITALKIFRLSQINRTNWQEDVNGGKLAAPYVVLDFQDASPVDFGAQNQTFIQQLAIIYVADRTSDSAYIDAGNHALGKDAEALVKDAAHDIRALMIGWGKSVNYTGGFQVLDEHPTITSSDMIEANDVFDSLLAKKIASQVKANVLIGETPLT